MFQKYRANKGFESVGEHQLGAASGVLLFSRESSTDDTIKSYSICNIRQVRIIHILLYIERQPFFDIRASIQRSVCTLSFPRLCPYEPVHDTKVEDAVPDKL